MSALIITLHILACVFLVVLVLLQSGKEGMGVIFGGSSGSLFGSTGAGGLLSKLTIGAAVVFFITSLSLTYMSGQGRQTETRESIILDTMEENQQAPAVPEQEQEQQGVELPPVDMPEEENAGQEGSE